ELASRAHLAALPAVVERALAAAGVSWSAVDAVAVTQGPGLVGALLVGVVYAKALAYAGGRRLIGVNHLEGHLFAPAVEDAELAPPFVALLVSGGHTLLLDVPAWGRYRLLGQTRDDAAGEAFDKVATLLGLGYPGGPAIERLAGEGDPARFTFPRPMIDEGLEFSFSGLKTAVLHAVRASTDLAADRAALARGFQDAVLDVLVTKLERAVEATGRRVAVLGGGVACSRALNEEYAADIVIGAVVGGLIGAKLWYVALTGASPFERGGFVWYGGFLGGAAGVILAGVRRRVPLRLTAEVCAPALALGYAL